MNGHQPAISQVGLIISLEAAAIRFLLGQVGVSIVERIEPFCH